MNTDLKSERDVETKLLEPLFHEVLGYPTKELEWAKKVKVTFGHETRLKEADLVAHVKGSPVVTVEAKRPTEPVRSGMGQVDSYAFALKTPISVVTNGRQFVVRRYYSLVGINIIDEAVEDLSSRSWAKVKNLIGFDNVRASIAERPNPVPVPDEVKIQDYRRFFRKLHNEIRDRDKFDPGAAFDELSKLLFLKAAEDEWRQQGADAPILTPEKIAEWEKLGPGEAQKAVNNWFRVATTKFFPGVFDDHPQILLSPPTLREVLVQMKPFHVKGGDADVKGRAFEEFLPSQLRGKGLGQFFTPRPVVDFMADMAGISIQDKVVDFSCGSGGFLIKAFEQMQRGVEQLPAGTLSRIGTSHDELLNDIKESQIYGVDAEPRAARTAKMNMLMWGDGRQVVRGNALDTQDFAGRPYTPQEYREGDPTSGCTLILANPPFGSKEKDAKILKRYALAGRGQDRGPAKTEVLFIEKGLKLLRPEGKMLIVLPQGLLGSKNNARVRDYINGEAEIRAVVSLPPHTFTPSGVPMVNTCVVYLQKFTAEKKRLYDTKVFGRDADNVRAMLRGDPDFDYPIFMGIAENIGYEPSGRITVKPGEQTDLHLLLADFAQPSDAPAGNVNVFDFANERYGETTATEDGVAASVGTRSLKTSFVVPFRETAERLDPPYYLLHRQAKDLLDPLKPLDGTIKEQKKKFKPKADAELDADYNVLSVSSDGFVTLNKRVKGEDFTAMKRVHAGDIAYNPMRANIGSFGVVPKALDGGYVSPDYVVFRSTAMDPDFLVMLLRSPFYRMYIDVTSTGSIRNRLYFPILQAIRVPEVSNVEQAALCAAAHRADAAHEAARGLAAERAQTVERLNELVRAPAAESGDGEEAFTALVERWRRETGMLSSLTKKLSHPAYRKIVDMGKPAVPLILHEMRQRPAYWFSALKEITGASPVPTGAKVDLKRATEMWLKWGEAEGHLK